MIKDIKIFLVIGLTSFFLFPFFFSFLPMINTKMILAVLGLMAYVLDRLKGETVDFERGLWSISAWALGVSFCSFLAMTINNTPDDSYLGYIVSMYVWLFAAYFCVSLMKKVHGHVTVETVGYYLLGVAILQCTLALLINLTPVLKGLVSTYVTGEKYMGVGVKDRLYGVGCALDVGGGRLGAILIIVVHLIILSVKRQSPKWLFICLMGSFGYILVIGNMIGRTTSVGAFLALAYLGYALCNDRDLKSSFFSSFFMTFIEVTVLIFVLCVGIYQTNEEFRDLLRFGFEGFFNFFETGTFETHSTNLLSSGMIFPDNIHTWIIGDGYMASGTNDPYYIGPSDYGFYMNTDAGYSRFLFYFGLIGLSTFILYFISVCRNCIQKMQHVRSLFITLLLLNFLIWIKVSTDLFVVFAPFLCLPISKDE